MVVAFVIAALVAAPGSSDAERFRSHFTQAEERYRKNDFGVAIWHFRQADALKPTPEAAYNLAKAHEKLGDRAFAAFYYRLYLRRAPRANDALQVAERIGSTLAALKRRRQGLLELEGASGGPIQVAHTHFPEFPVAVALPAGKYTVTVRAGNALKLVRVEIRAGEVTRELIETVQPPLVEAGKSEAQVWAEVGAELSRPLAPAPAGWQEGPSSALRTGSYVTLAASAVALGAGVLMGVLANADASRLARAPGQLTVSQAQATAARANSRGAAANALWIAGGVGALAGGTMFVFSLPASGGKDKVKDNHSGAPR